MGECNVKNELIENDLQSLTIKKLKFNCTKTYSTNDEFKRSEKILNSLIDRKIEAVYKVSNDFVIQNVSAVDFTRVYSEFNSKSVHLIESKYYF